MKTAKGTIDYDPKLFGRLYKIINIIRKNVLLMGVEEIDTPTMELTKVLLNKYGDEAENKLIYKLEKIGTEDLSLRYDLTVPLQRYIESEQIESIKRFQTGKVYRKDTPNQSRCRLREFIQADYDIVGEYELMIPEAEIMRLITISMKQIGIENYVIKINFRNNLEKIVSLAKIDMNLFKSVCTSIDKLDKHSWSYVTNELKLKGLSDESISILQTLLNNNYQDDSINSELTKLMEYGEIFNYNKYIQFDSKLARGLDYYTGIIYEVLSTEKILENPSEDLEDTKDIENTKDEDEIMTNPTIIAGGRYDKLIKYKNKKYLPAIGVSFGINRIEMFMEKKDENINQGPMRIYVVSEFQYIKKKLEIVNYLWNNGYKVQYYDGQKKNIKQINQAIKENYHYILIYGEDGPENIKVKRNDHSKDEICKLNDLISYLIINPFIQDPKSL